MWTSWAHKLLPRGFSFSFIGKQPNKDDTNSKLGIDFANFDNIQTLEKKHSKACKAYKLQQKVGLLGRDNNHNGFYIALICPSGVLSIYFQA